MKEYDSLSDNEKRNMLASVANLYYNAEMTQNQIAERFFTSRSKISRMLYIQWQFDYLLWCKHRQHAERIDFPHL